MYKNILCAIDNSAESKVILGKAHLIATKFEAALSIIHVIEYKYLPKDYQKRLKEDVIPKVDIVAEKYNVPKKHRYIKFGQAYSKICEIAEKYDSDLVVLGSHGKHGFRTLLGSTATGVLNHAKCDVHLSKFAG